MARLLRVIVPLTMIAGLMLPLIVIAAASPRARLAGQVGVVWGDPEVGTAGRPTVHYFLSAGSDTIEVDLPTALVHKLGGAMAINRQDVILEGRWITPPGIRSGVPTFRADTISLAQSTTPHTIPQAILGSQPWAMVLCKFADSTAETHPLAYYTGLISASYPGINHYWREVSYGRMNTDGSAAFGWFVLPHPRAYYVGGGSVDLTSLAQDCATAGASRINYNAFGGINAVFNAELSGSDFGGITTLTLNGTRRSMRITWLQASFQQASLAHEMGHGFGLNHSRGADGGEYSNPFDVMSNLSVCGLSDPTYKCIGQHLSSPQKHLLGWIAPGEAFTSTGGHQTVTLRRLALPPDRHYLQLVVPVDDFGYFTIETRAPAGYDRSLPNTVPVAVVHYVDSDGIPYLYYTQGTNTSLKAGQSLYLAAAKVVVSVDAATPANDGLTITVSPLSHRLYLPLTVR